MTPITLLAAVGGAPDDEDAIAVAADLAHRHQSSAVVVNTFVAAPALIIEPVGVGTTMRPQVWQAMSEREEAVRRQIRGLVDREAKRFGLSDTPCAAGSIRLAAPVGDGTSLMRELPLVDLAVVAQSSVTGEGAWIGALDEALMAAKVPVYVARDGHTAAAKAAAIAWDGSFEAARAVRAALPLLKDAAEIAILQDPERLETRQGSSADPERLKAYLGAHGVAVETVMQVRGAKVGPALLDAAQAFGAALLVAGAYRHSRLAEALFGGATRAFLEARDGPHLLIAH